MSDPNLISMRVISIGPADTYSDRGLTTVRTWQVTAEAGNSAFTWTMADPPAPGALIEVSWTHRPPAPPEHQESER